MQYDAFISYSHRADGDLARDLQRGLERLSKPWYRRRPFLTVFRDQTSFAAGADLGERIRGALDDSSHLVVLLSPESAASPWVDDEIGHWLATRSRDDMTVVVTDWGPTPPVGAPEMSLSAAVAAPPNLGSFEWDGVDVPPALRGVFEEPLAVDMRWAREALADGPLTLSHAAFQDDVAEIAANVRHQNKDALVGELVGMRARAKVLTGTVLLALLILGTAIAVSVPSWLKARSDVEAARTELAGLLVDLETARSQVAAAEERLGSAIDAAAVAEGARERAEADLARVRSSLDATTGELAAANLLLDEATAAAASAQAELATATRALERTNADLDRATADLESALEAKRAAELGQIDAEITRTEAEIDRSTGEIELIRGSGALAESEADQGEAELSRRIQQRLADAENQLARSRRLAGEASSIVERQPATAVLLAMASERFASASDTERARAEELRLELLALELRNARAARANASTNEAAIAELDRVIADLAREVERLQRDRQQLAESDPVRGTSIDPSARETRGAAAGRPAVTGSADASRAMMLALFGPRHIVTTLPNGSSFVDVDDTGTRAVVSDGDVVRLVDVSRRGWDDPDAPAIDGVPAGRVHVGGDLVVAHDPGYSHIVTWDVASAHHELLTVEGTASLRTVEFHAGRRVLAAGDDRGRLHLWQLDADGRAQQYVNSDVRGVECADECPINTVAFSPTGSQVFAAGVVVDPGPDHDQIERSGGAVFRGDVSSLFSDDPQWTPVNVGALDHAVDFHVFDIDVSPTCDDDGVCLLAVGSNDESVRITNVNAHPDAPTSCASLRQHGCVAGHEGAVNGVSFSDDGRTLASASRDLTVRIWSVGLETATVSGEAAAADAGAPTSDAATVPTIAPAKVLIGHPASVEGVEFRPGTSELVSYSVAGPAVVWNLDVPAPAVRSGETEPGTYRPRRLNAVAVLADGTPVTSDANGGVRAWDPGRGRSILPGTSTGVLDGVERGVDCLAQAPMRVSDLAAAPRTPAGASPLAAGTGDEDAGCSQGSAWYWPNAQGGDLGDPIRLDLDVAGHPVWVNSLAFDREGCSSGDGCLLAATVRSAETRTSRAPTRGAVVTWTAGSTATPAGRFDAPSDVSAVDVVTLPSGRRVLLVASWNQGVQVVDADSGQVLETVQHGQAYVDSIAAQPTGGARIIVATGGTSSIRFWELAEDADGVAFTAVTDALGGPSGWVGDLAWTPDGRLLGVGSEEDHAVHFWHAAAPNSEGEAVAPVQIGRFDWAHSARVTGVSISEDGRSMVTVGHDGRLRMWPLSWEDWESHACRLAQRGLTDAEWQRFAGGGQVPELC